MFLHGWGGSASAFLFVAKRLAGYKSIVVDFSEFGDSEEPKRPYTVRDYAEETIALLEEEGESRVTVVGHSFGGRVAMEIAVLRPDLVRSLVLVDSAGLKPRRKPSYYFRVYLHKLLVRLGFKGLKGSKDYRVLSPVMRETFKNVVSYDQSGILCDITCPTAIFWGREDRVTPLYMAKKLKRGIKGSEIFLLGGGHFAYVDDADKFVSVLRAFLYETKDGNTDFGGKTWY